MGEQSVGEGVVIANVDVNSIGHFQDFGSQDIRKTDEVTEAIGKVESDEFRETLLAIHEGVTKIADEGLHIEVNAAKDQSSEKATFRTIKTQFSEKMVLYATTEGRSTTINDMHHASGLSVEVGAIAIQDRGDKGVLVTRVIRNGSKAYINMYELNNDVPFDAVRANEQGQLSIEEYQVRRGESMEIELNQGLEYPSESGSSDEKYNFLSEARFYHQEKLGPAIIETLEPLMGVTHSSLSAQGYGPPAHSL